MQTNVQKTDAVRFGSGTCEIFNGSDWINIGMIKDANLATSKLIKQFIGANAKLPPKSKITETKFNFNLYEIDLTTINLISGDGVYSTIPGVSKDIIGEALGTGWTVGTPIVLKEKNGDKTKVNAITIDSDGSALTENTDYSVYVDGKGFTSITPLTAQSGVLDADYSYVPNASKTMEFGDADKTLALQKFRFVNTNSEGKVFSFEILKGYNSEGISIGFQGDEDEDPASMAVSITAFPDDNASSDSQNLFKIYDEQSVL